MKAKNIFTAIGGVLLVSCAPTQQDNLSEALKARLIKVSESGGFAIGHHDDTAYGHTWKYEAGRSDVREVTGDYPAILSWDLGMIEVEAANNLDGVPFDFIREQVRKHTADGGISTFSWHVMNPLTQGNSWDVSGADPVHRAVTPSDSIHQVMTEWIGNAADFFLSLKDTPVIFRPWHEHTGTWFWWGLDQCTKDDYIALWKMTRQIFDEKGVKNVVWAYSPDKSNCGGIEDYLDRYPGDEYVDIMGADVYHLGGEEGVEQYSEWMHNTLGAAVEAAKAHGKIAALTETGAESVPMTNWFTEVLMPLIKDYPIAYIC
ncbi:MAG: beta-mannosidase, partial [Bacteroidaceae bacterium]|nr:beta-mannosidase [Bacteroidaceae bacterium]